MVDHKVVSHNEWVAARKKHLAKEKEFTRLRDGTFGDRHERVEPRPREFSLGKVRVKPLFAPRAPKGLTRCAESPAKSTRPWRKRFIRRHWKV